PFWTRLRVAIDRCDEREPAPRERLHEPRIVGGVAERRTQLSDAIGEAAVEVDVRVAAPDVRAQLLASDEIAGARDEERERTRRLRFERNWTAGPRQERRSIVEREDAEAIHHGRRAR